MEHYTDYSEEASDSKRDNGPYRLWLAVTINAVEELKGSKGRDGLAWSWIFDENPFLEYVCEILNMDIEVFRERLKAATRKIKKMSF
jgi:hypothetical protein